MKINTCDYSGGASQLSLCSNQLQRCITGVCTYQQNVCIHVCMQTGGKLPVLLPRSAPGEDTKCWWFTLENSRGHVV